MLKADSQPEELHIQCTTTGYTKLEAHEVGWAGGERDWACGRGLTRHRGGEGLLSALAAGMRKGGWGKAAAAALRLGLRGGLRGAGLLTRR
jgi:hypothetical protein